jgi:hypothetical protein
LLIEIKLLAKFKGQIKNRKIDLNLLKLALSYYIVVFIVFSFSLLIFFCYTQNLINDYKLIYKYISSAINQQNNNKVYNYL